MRPFFLFVAFAGLVLGAIAPAQAQSGGNGTAHGEIQWGGYADVLSRNSRKQRVPAYSEAHQVMDDQVGWFSLRINSAVSQGELANMVYEPFSAADAKMYNVSKLPAGPEPQLASGTEMKRTVTHLSLRPVRRNPQTGQPERLVSFDYNYTTAGSGVAARSTAAARSHVDRSVLRSGDWYKMGVAESGIYKLDKATLRSMGLNPQGINPNNLHVYGNSMGILPQANAAYRPDDIIENNVLFVGDTDTNFDDNEYFLFYSPGAHTWAAQGGLFRHRNNIYTDTTYYFVTVNGTAGRRVLPEPALPAANARTISTFAYHDFHEHDLVNLMHSGRNWVGEGFRPGAQRDFVFSNTPDLVPNSLVRVTTSFVAGSSLPSSFQVTLNGTNAGGGSLDARPTCDYCSLYTTNINTSQTTLANPGNELRVGLTYNSGDVSASGYLDYLEINAERQIKLSGSQLEFRSLANIAPGARNRYVLANATGATVWDVTNPRRIVARPIDAGTSSFVAPADTLREFVLLQTGGAFNTPRPFGKVENQNLHALNNTAGTPLLDLVIVTYPPFYGQALRLANHRISHDKMRVAVVTTTQVYNEYGSGGQDVTAIRDFMKQLYDLAPTGKQMQLLLFGDASFDYKSDPTNDTKFYPSWFKNERVPFKNDPDFDAFNQNYVPTYESRESLAPFQLGGLANPLGESTYSSDDYYAHLDDNEGEWAELGSNELLDIGVGRLPIRTPKGQPRSTDQARQVVDKIIGYDAPAAYGKWRNRITMVADDGNGNLFIRNDTTTNTTAGSDGLARIIKARYPVYNVHKVYLDLYPQQAVSAGQRAPDMNRAIDQSIEQGSLIVNYLGHGGPKGWADEQIVTNASVLALRNPNNLTFFTTGTCDFSTYDNPDFTSAGEQALTDNATGGAVGLFTTTRVVEAGQNAGLVKAYFKRVLAPYDGKMPSIGTIVMLSKNDYTSNNNRNYSLLADPSMTLAYPKQTVVVDAISKRNAAGVWVNADTLQALARVQLRGRVLNNGALNTSFTGTAQVTIYDKPTTATTLGNEPDDTAVPIEVQESIIYGGQANVVNGQFSLSFVVPKDINYNAGIGKISLYAYDGTTPVDANGYRLTPVGGADRGAPEDTTPPEIKLYMDTDQFAYGGLTAQNTTLLAFLSDSSGINTTGAGIGHDITAVLDNDPSKLLVLNDRYISSVGNFKQGKVDNPFKDLAVGPHTLRLKAWDTYNNSAEKEIEFTVAHDQKLALDHVLNYPNPFANSTRFLFGHNQAGGEPDNLEVQVQIFTVAGHLVRTLTAIVPNTIAYKEGIEWNGRDDFDDKLARGVYVYRLSVRSQHNGSTASKYEKLVILN